MYPGTPEEHDEIFTIFHLEAYLCHFVIMDRIPGINKEETAKYFPLIPELLHELGYQIINEKIYVKNKPVTFHSPVSL